MGGRHKYDGVLPGALRGSFTTPANYHPSATQPLAQYLTLWLSWFGSVKNRTLTSLQDLECMFGEERGVPDGQWECDTCWSCGCDQEELYKWTALGMALSQAQRLAAPYQHSRETTQVVKVTSIWVPCRIHPGQTVVIPKSYNAAAWEAPVVKTPLPFMGT
jgi:hypothetical protein